MIIKKTFCKENSNKHEVRVPRYAREKERERGTEREGLKEKHPEEQAHAAAWNTGME